MERADHPIELLMVHADDHQPVLPGGLTHRLAPNDSGQDMGDEDESDPDELQFLLDDVADRNDLVAQRWGVLYPDTEAGRRYLEIIRPLIQHRQEQQGGYDVITKAVGPLRGFDQAMRWRREHYDCSTTFDIDLPRYVLMLGDLWELPLELQQAMANRYNVGRLAFNHDHELEAYVHKVLSWETRPASQRWGRALFHTVHDRSGATQLGYRALIKPGVALANSGLGHAFMASAVVETGRRFHPTPEDLLSVARVPEPSVLLSVSHGEGPPTGGWSSARQRELRQGAMSFGRQMERPERYTPPGSPTRIGSVRLVARTVSRTATLTAWYWW